MSQFETERLLFRPHLAADLEAYCAMESDPLYRAPQPVLPRGELERNFRENLLPPKNLGLLATVLKAEGRYIGRCGLYPHRLGHGDIAPGEAVLAFYLDRAFWGRGLATEAGRAFVRYGFETLHLTRILAAANIDNVASNRAIQKSGLIHTHSGGGAGGGERWHAYELRNPSLPAPTPAPGPPGNGSLRA
jgi:ribosomal-protein-alanine N-acetyltransferase